MTFLTVWRTCPNCGTRFGQPDDPGRKRRYCADACKQAAYRARRRAEHRAWQDDPARKRARGYARRRQDQERARDEQARERARQRQQRQQQQGDRTQPPPHAGSAGSGGQAESPGRARARRIIEALLRKAERTTFPYEAAACRAKVEELRRKHGL